MKKTREMGFKTVHVYVDIWIHKDILFQNLSINSMQTQLKLQYVYFY